MALPPLELPSDASAANASSPARSQGLSLLAILGALLLTWSASVYSAFGIGAFPRQEWLVESLFGAFFVLPVVQILRTGGGTEGAIRMVGFMLLLHSGWDALHWPGHAIIPTPIDPRIPSICPLLDLPLGLILFLRDR